MKLFDFFKSKSLVSKAVPTVLLDSPLLSAYAGQTSFSPFNFSVFDGGKFYGGFGDTQIHTVDYWTLRKRSAQLFTENLYARGLIRRFVTNEINTGLSPESSPDEKILGFEEDGLTEWTEEVEMRFSLWGKSPQACDWKRQSTFGEIQRAARREALIEGDILVVLRLNPMTKLPCVQLVTGSSVQTPWGDNFKLRAGHKITHGVEFDAEGRVFGYHVRQTSGAFEFLPAYGGKTRRRLAWLVFGTDKRLDDVRGQPLLSIVLQSLKEIDRYRDSAQRKAVINSILAMFIKKGEERMGTLPMQGGAIKKSQFEISDSTTNGVPRKLNLASQIPGFVIDELQYGEEPVLKGGDGTDINFQAFEEAVIRAVAWANEVPPEVLTLSFSSNYSASQAATNEFRIYLNRVWSEWGETFCSPIYADWLVSEVLLGKIRADGLLDAYRNPVEYDVLAAWMSADWYGAIKPSTDMLKQVKASELLIAGGYSTRAREARILTGTKYSKNIKRLRRENEQITEANRPIIESQQTLRGTQTEIAAAVDRIDELDARIDEYLEDVERQA